MKSGHVLVLALLGEGVFSFAIPREKFDKEPGLVRRMTDEMVKKIEAGERLTEENGVRVTVGSGPTARTDLLDADYFNEEEDNVVIVDLEKRKGGGGHGGGGHSSGGHSSGHSSSHASHASSRGGVYGGGGGAVFAAGATAPVALSAGLLAALAVDTAIWPGYWSSEKMWVYPFNSTYDWNFHNSTLGKNETKPVACVCVEHQSCTCKATNDSQFIAELVKNGTFGELNKTQITVADLSVNGTVTPTILLNGTVANGTESTSGASSVLNRNSALAIAMGVLATWAVV